VLADELPQVLAAALDGKAAARVRRSQGTERRAALGR
jgi:hypothetical protein